MELIQPVIHTALTGTGKRQLKKEDLPAGLGEAFDLIDQSGTEKEEQFLQLAAVLFNYLKCGTLPLHQADASLPKAAGEEKDYVTATAHAVLKDILAAESVALAEYWLQACAQVNGIVQPELAPSLLALGVKHSSLQPLVCSCTGKRGEWLGTLNADWQFGAKETDEERWQTGTAEQRRQVLQKLRRHDPAKARIWLQQAWAQENANTRADLLPQLSLHIAGDDMEWLETLMTEKSAKVKEAALALLKMIPASRVVQQYRQLLQQSVTLKKERGLLGIGSKTTVEMHLPAAIDEKIFTSGIEKLSNRKEFTDEEFIIYQLMQQVPPQSWETHLSATPHQIIAIFKKHKGGKKFLQAFAHAVHRFNDGRWALAMMEQSDEFYAMVAALLPLPQWKTYSLQYFDQFPEDIIRQSLLREEEWSMELTEHIFKHAAKHPYNYNRAFFAQHIRHVPVAAMASFKKYTPAEAYLKNVWNNTSAYATQLLTLKLQTIQAFPS